MALPDGITLAVAITGAVTGTTGMVLGIINTWRQFDKDRVKLRVVPKLAFQIGNTVVATDRADYLNDDSPASDFLKHGAKKRLCIEITNLSAFPVTISQAGFGGSKSTRFTLFGPLTSTGQPYPTRLEPRQSVTLYMGVGADLDPRYLTKAIAYAQTDCGHTAYGTSPAFNAYVDLLLTEGSK
jgi:hypothetical protein